MKSQLLALTSRSARPAAGTPAPSSCRALVPRRPRPAPASLPTPLPAPLPAPEGLSKGIPGLVKSGKLSTELVRTSSSRRRPPPPTPPSSPHPATPCRNFSQCATQGARALLARCLEPKRVPRALARAGAGRLSVRVCLCLCVRVRAPMHTRPKGHVFASLTLTCGPFVQKRNRGREKGTEERGAKKVTQVGDWVCET